MRNRTIGIHVAKILLLCPWFQATVLHLMVDMRTDLQATRPEDFDWQIFRYGSKTWCIERFTRLSTPYPIYESKLVGIAEKQIVLGAIYVDLFLLFSIYHYSPWMRRLGGMHSHYASFSHLHWCWLAILLEFFRLGRFQSHPSVEKFSKDLS